MNIKIYVLSDKSDKFFIDARNEYEKRLSRYCKLSIKHFKRPDKLLSEIQNENNIIFIRNNGKLLSSKELADKINNMEINGTSEAVVAVGLEEGIINNFIDNPIILSISRMSISVPLTEVVLLEQIYRAYKIIRGETYHK